MRTEVVTTLKRKATKLLARMKILEGIIKGEQAIQDGRTMDMDEARDKMNKWLK